MSELGTPIPAVSNAAPSPKTAGPAEIYDGALAAVTARPQVPLWPTEGNELPGKPRIGQEVDPPADALAGSEHHPDGRTTAVAGSHAPVGATRPPTRVAPTGSSTVAPESAAPARYPELTRLLDLKRAGWMFQPAVVDGRVELLAGWRVWLGGWSDAIAIRDSGDVKAFRCDPDGGQVWSREGSLAEVLDSLLELPHPADPGVSRLVKRTRLDLWLPGMPQPVGG